MLITEMCAQSLQFIPTRTPPATDHGHVQQWNMQLLKTHLDEHEQHVNVDWMTFLQDAAALILAMSAIYCAKLVCASRIMQALRCKHSMLRCMHQSILRQ